MELRESFASKYLISICTISQNIKMPLLCYIILTMASQWPTKFQVQGQCFKVKQNNQSRKSQKLFIFGASNLWITSHSQCQSKFPKTIHLNRISTKFLIIWKMKLCFDWKSSQCHTKAHCSGFREGEGCCSGMSWPPLFTQSTSLRKSWNNHKLKKVHILKKYLLK